MKINSTELKTRLGEYLTESMHQPVFITRHNYEAVLLSKKEYQRLQDIEDAYLLNEIHVAEEQGYIGVKDSMKKLKSAFDKSQ